MASFQAQERVFEFGGGRELVATEKAVELLACVAHVDNPLSIRLSNKSFTSEAAALIATKLTTFHAVEIADISDIIAGRPEEDALLTLKTICDSIEQNKLIELNVSDNALGAKGVTALTGVITCKTLQRLYVCNNGLSAEATVLLAQLLIDGGCPKLTLLHFYNNMSGDGGAVAVGDIVKACPQLENFRFSATRSQREGCKAIALALNTINKLTRLDLCDNSFGNDAGKLLATSLRNHPLLIHLNLRDCGLGEKGSSAVIHALKDAAVQLEFLDLSGNDMTATEAEELGNVLLSVPCMSKLRELALDDNEIGSDGVIAIAAHLKTLQEFEIFSICTCEVTAVGAYIVARAVAKLPRFSILRIDGNQICTRGVEEIAATLTRAGKVLAEMEDNDEDGDDDGLEDALEAAEDEDVEGCKDGNEEEDDLVQAMEAATIDK